MQVGPGGERPYHVPAGDAADQAPIRIDHGDAALGRDPGQEPVEAKIRPDRLGAPVEQAGHRLARAGSGERAGAQAADEAPLVVGDQPGIAALARMLKEGDTR